jgi:hypothetical protein
MELCTDYTLSPEYNIQRSMLCWFPQAADAAFYLSFLASSCCLLSYMPKPYGTVTKPASRQTGHALKKTEKGGDDVPPMNVGTTRLL